MRGVCVRAKVAFGGADNGWAAQSRSPERDARQYKVDAGGLGMSLWCATREDRPNDRQSR
jgi:hypothetical protein